MFNRVCIVGTGLIGGSFGLDLKNLGLAREVVGVARRQQTIDDAVNLGVCDFGSTEVVEAAMGADLVFLAPPVGQMKSICEQIAPVVAPDAIVTDAGSTKAGIVAQCEPYFASNGHFIGGHPMAGGEKTGPQAARHGLFQNATWILTTTEHTNDGALEQLELLIGQLGARPIILDSATHDGLLAVTSHLPHITAAALTHVFAVASRKSPVARSLVAGGWKDGTRVASGSSEMWRDICLANRDAILEVLDNLNLEINHFRAALTKGSSDELGNWFEEAARERSKIN